MHALINGDLPCPVATDTDATRILTTTFGALWVFKPKDLQRSLSALKREDITVFNRVSQQLDAGSATIQGSWLQRNAALYTVVCDTLDLSKSGKDLGFLEIVQASNSMCFDM